MKAAAIALLTCVLLSSSFVANAGEKQFYGPNNEFRGHSTSRPNGSEDFYDKFGRFAGRSTTRGNEEYFYDKGRSTTRNEPEKPRPRSDALQHPHNPFNTGKGNNK